ncbi:MAG: hypothetical protein ISR61_09325 [Desulfobacteraceae bacterium]|uniref:Uncharacterized protein n=1 Tax=Candidatus Desulfacyla euxinica TaxID=2841693 RepID=A0A8J6N3Y2_9DELT|nr:hypothetical protein [Candidatus Desulfacyla euxinica]MBL6979139.1 hypothetical protein [Desulfobacteraceae bacterium]
MSDPIYEQQHGYYLEEISPGMSAVYAKTIREAVVALGRGVVWVPKRNTAPENR